MKRKTLYFFLALGLTFLFFAFFRYFNLEKRLSFDWDQEQFTTQVRDIIANHKFTLIGPRVVGAQGFFLAPYFTYILIPFFLLTKLHPIALLYFIYLFSAVFFFTSYLILKKVFNPLYGLFFLIFWSLNYALVDADIKPWWPLFIPLGVLTTWYLLHEIYTKNRVKDYIFLGVCLGFFMNMHFQFIFILLFTIVFFIYLYFLEKKKKLKYEPAKLSLLFATFVAMFTPLLLFDLRHNFLNVKLFVQFFLPKAEHSIDPKVWWTVFSNFLQPLTLVKYEQLTVICYLIFFLIMNRLYKLKKGFHKAFYFATMTIWLSFPLFFSVYGVRPSEYYFDFLYPFIFLILIDFFITYKKTYLLIGLFVFLFAINISPLRNELKTNYYRLYYKDQVVQKIKELGAGKRFNVSFEVWPNGDTGYRYLIDWYKIKQTGDPVDQLIRIRTTPLEGDILIGGFGLYVPKDLPSY